ncbi:MAG: hypothetical protein M0R51_17010 [Clostridia bacterium]|jgi:hypothetical protein|nr:hypothetical protein [Clostridia bacterium]
MAKKTKIKSQTRSAYNKWRTLKWSLYGGTYTLPLVPAMVMVGVNWDEWVAQSRNAWSIGLGFGMLLLTVFITILGIAKKDEVINKIASPLFYFAGILALWAFSLLFLSRIASEFGYMLLWTCLGLLAGASADQVNRSLVKKELAFYKKLIVDVGLDSKTEKRKLQKQLAKEEAEREKAARQPVE